jgi:membrane protein
MLRRKAPKGPSDLSRRSWWSALKRTFSEAREDGITDWAAALTYYGVLAIFPALLALVSILGLIGSSATQPVIDNLGTVAPGAARDIFTDAVRNLQEGQGTAGVLFILGLAGALWSASGYVATFMRAANAIYDIDEGRPFWKAIPVRLGITLALLLMVVVVAVAVTFTGPLAKHAGDVIGVGSSAVTAWDIAKWPVILLVVMTMFALLYWAAPNVRHPGFRWLTPGAAAGVLLWIAASAGFAFYVANFGSYNKTYGALGAVIVFLVWLWISNLAILLGAELDAELERSRAVEAGASPEREPFLEPRSARKLGSAH